MARRSRGDGGLYWVESKQAWVGSVDVGFDARGKRIRRQVRAKTKTEAREKLKAVLREVDLGVDLRQGGITVADLMRAWLQHAHNGRAQGTVDRNQSLVDTHIVPAIGRKKLRDLRAHDIDRMLSAKRTQLSTSTLQRVLSILRRAIRWAEARDFVGRNVALLCTAPTGKGGRPSKSMTLDQARALMAACVDNPLGAYVILAILIGLRNEELRALTWEHVDLVGDPKASPPVPSSVKVWRSVRAGGDTKTKLSRRTIALPSQGVAALEKHRASLQEAGRYSDDGLVFGTSAGTQLDQANVRRDFRVLCTKAGLTAEDWTPREMRHSFVSLMSEAGVATEDIARMVGHTGGSKVTETVYRKQLKPVLNEGTQIMESLFDLPENRSAAGGAET